MHELTLMNHIGIYLIVLFILYLQWSFDDEKTTDSGVRVRWYHCIFVAFMFTFLIEIPFWIINIFFIN